MTIPEPFPELQEILTAIGEAGQRLSDIDASEGAAGNISVFIGWPMEVRRLFPLATEIDLPVRVPHLVGRLFFITGSGRRLRDILSEPTANLAAIVINEGGASAQQYTGPGCLFTRVTSEFNSHLAIHHDQILRSNTNFHAVIHAQPTHITYLSHIPRYQNQAFLNEHLMRWQPETIVNLPSGIGVIPFHVPGSEALMQATVESLRQHRLVIWSKHGVVARSDISVKRASDRIEYAEIAARYEYLNLINREQAEGLSKAEIQQIIQDLGLDQTLY